MTGIIGAMHIEVETIKSLMENKISETISGVEYVRGSLHGKEIVIAACGIGKVAAAMCTQTMILKYSPECIINTGVGGSLSTKLAIGDIAVAESLVQHDMDTSPLGDPIGLISGINIVNIPADKKVLKPFLKALKPLKTLRVSRALSHRATSLSQAKKRRNSSSKILMQSCAKWRVQASPRYASQTVCPSALCVRFRTAPTAHLTWITANFCPSQRQTQQN